MLTLNIVSVYAIAPIYTSSTTNGIELINVIWRSSSGDPHVYPGSNQASLLVELRNNYNGSIRDVVGCLVTPPGFMPSLGRGLCTSATAPNGSSISSIPAGYVFHLRYLLDVNESIVPGTYNFTIEISYLYNFSYLTENITFTINIDEYPPLGLGIVDVYWEPEDVYPSTQSATIVILLKNYGESSISNGYLVAYLPKEFEPNKIRIMDLNIAPQSVTSVRLRNIDILPNCTPGSYVFKITINATSSTSDGVEYTGYWNTTFTLTVEKPKQPNIEILDTGFREKIVYTNSRLVDLYVTLVNNELATINTITARLILPQGVRTIDNKTVSVTAFNGQIGFGETATLVFSDLNISTTDICLRLNLTLDLIMSYRGARYYIKIYRTIQVNLTNYENYLRITQVKWIYNGEPATPLPTAQDIELQLVLVNTGPRTIRTIIPNISLPEGFNIKDISLQSYKSVSPGGVAIISIRLDIDESVIPSTYEGMIYLWLIVSSDNSLLYTTQTIKFPLTVGDPKNYMPSLKIINFYWGRGTPQQVYPGARYAELYIDIYNFGRYPASNAIARIIPLNNTVVVIEGNRSLGTIGLGEIATAVFTLDLRDAIAGKYRFTIAIDYAIRVYGSYMRYTVMKNISLELQAFEGSRPQGIVLVDYGWNNPPAYPCTENISYTITLANRHPYSIEAMEAKLMLPSGITGRYGEDIVQTYIPGPIQSMQELELSFTLTIGDIEPGTYNSTLNITYVVLSGGAGKRSSLELSIPIQVNSIRDSVEYIDSYWLYASPEPGKYGQYLVIVYRNNMVPSIHGIYAEVNLPKGIIYTHTNTSYGKIYPSYIGTQPPQQVITSTQSVFKNTPIQLSSLLQNPLQTAASKGDYIVFIIPVNILSNVSLGDFVIHIKLNFIDHTGNTRVLETKAKAVMLGNIEYLSIDLPQKIYIKDLVNNINITINSIGSGKIHNVYLILYPSMPLILPERSIYYFDTIELGKPITLKIKLYYNPLYTASAPMSIKYGSIPMMVSLYYIDPMGYTHYINTSVSIILYPFIKLNIYDINAVYRDGLVKVSGAIMNIGSSTAERIVAYIVVDGINTSTFIGDLDPGSEATFSVEAYVKSKTTNATLVITYADAYDQYHRIKLPIEITYEQVREEEIVEKPLLSTTECIVLGLIALFLATVAIVIYRALKQHERRLEEIQV